MSMTRLCPACAGKLADRYDTTAYTDRRAHCALCGAEGYVYGIEPKNRQRGEKRRSGSGYSGKEREKYVKRRKWA
jgi:hypothetical protein